MALNLDWAGTKSYEVRTDSRAFAGIIAWNERRDHYHVYFNSTATRGTKRTFPTVEAALDFIRDRRIKKGWRV